MRWKWAVAILLVVTVGATLFYIWATRESRQTAMIIDMLAKAQGEEVKHQRVMLMAENLAEVKEFLRFYPTAILNLGRIIDPQFNACFTAKTPIAGRYSLGMSIKLKLPEDWNGIVAKGAPEFHFVEVSKIISRPDGVVKEIRYSQTNQKYFQVDEWKKLVESNFDYSVINLSVKTNEPLKGFEAYWNRRR
jgi:hypothetical protein